MRSRATNASDEIEVTPEMIAVGVNELSLFEFADPGEWIVSAVYRAMHAAKEGLEGGKLPD
jgi:hypothetical protein